MVTFLYEPDHKRGLFLALNQALNNRGLLSKMGDYNLNLTKNFDWREIGKNPRNIYNSFKKINKD